MGMGKTAMDALPELRRIVRSCCSCCADSEYNICAKKGNNTAHLIFLNPSIPLKDPYFSLTHSPHCIHSQGVTSQGLSANSPLTALITDALEFSLDFL